MRRHPTTARTDSSDRSHACRQALIQFYAEYTRDAAAAHPRDTFLHAALYDYRSSRTRKNLPNFRN
jgi:hypothetical protein